MELIKQLISCPMPLVGMIVPAGPPALPGQAPQGFQKTPIITAKVFSEVG
jgi:hypothetical protein